MNNAKDFTNQISVFDTLKKKFDSLVNYNEKLVFWTKKKLQGLNYVINYEYCTISDSAKPKLQLEKWGSFHKKQYYKVDKLTAGELIKLTSEEIAKYRLLSQYTDYITIVPKNPVELEELFVWTKSKQNTMLNFDLTEQIGRYWRQIETSPLFEEYLQNQFDQTNVLNDNYYNNPAISPIINDTNKPIENILFNIGYRQVFVGDSNINFINLFDETYGKLNRQESILYNNTELTFIHFLHGRSAAVYKGFLIEQLKRMNNGENIRLPVIHTDHPIKVSQKDEAKIKLKWNSTNRVLYDLFAQLMIATNGKGEPVIENTISSIATFIAQNVDGFTESDIKVIQREIEKMRTTDSVDIPKKNRIVLNINITQ